MAITSYFGKCDRRNSDPSKEIVNTIPLWQNDRNTEDLKDQLDQMDKKEAEGGIVGKVRARFLQRKAKMKEMYESILESDPRGKLSPLEKDRARRALRSFGEKLGMVMPTKSDMQTPNKVKPARLAQVAKTPCIKLDSNDEFAEAKLSNIKINSDGMVSKDSLYHAAKNTARALGEEFDAELFRKPGFTPAGRNDFVGYDPVVSDRHAEIFGEKPLNNIEDNQPKAKSVKMWVCDHVDAEGKRCGREMKIQGRNFHLRQHKLKEERAKKKLVTQEA